MSDNNSKEVVRTFVRELASVNDKLKVARQDLKDECNGCDEMIVLIEEGKGLLLRKKELINTHVILREYQAVLEDVKEEKKQLVSDAKTDGIQKKEVDMAISMLKKDIDPVVTADMFRSIADLVS